MISNNITEDAFLDSDAIAVNPTTNKVYVGYADSNSVSVIDGTTDKISNGSILIGKSSTIAVNPTTNMIYVPNDPLSGSVSVINGKTNSVLTAQPDIKGLAEPEVVAVNPTTNKVYALGDHSVSVIDGTTDKVLSNNDTANISVPEAIAVNPTTNMIYVANSHSNSVSVIDPYMGYSIAENITVGISPYAIAVNPTTNMIYVANHDSNSVSVIDGTTDKVLSNNITAGIAPYAIAVNPTTNKVYVANHDSHSVSVIDGSINEVVAAVSFNIHPFNAGHIKCNNNNISTNIYLRIRSGTQCKAEPNSGFVFSSWSENLGHNSSKTIMTSPIYDL